jgi:hypothetical protein
MARRGREPDGDFGKTEAPMMESVDVRAHLVETLRRDLIGPGPSDLDLRDELLKENPSRWYLGGFLAPAPDDKDDEADEAAEEGDPLFGEDEGADPQTGNARAGRRSASR